MVRKEYASIGGSRRFMGQPLRPPIGAFQRGNSFGYYLVSPLFVSGVPGRVKSRPVSAFVGVKGEDIRTLRVKRPEANPKTTASTVCRKAAGMPGRAKTSSSSCQPHSAILSPYSVHVTWNTQSTCNSTYVVPHARGHRGPCGGVQRRME
jgi:hypothetical protein